MIVRADARALPIASGTVQCCVTSPPYWGLRDYGVVGQLGLERTPDLYVANMVAVFREVWRVLRDDGTLWLNLGSSYMRAAETNVPHYTTRLKQKDMVPIPWMVAMALQADGWYLRSDIIWSKPNPMPESVTDRPTKAHEYVFLLTKSQRYYWDAEAVAEPYADATVRRGKSIRQVGADGSVVSRANGPVDEERGRNIRSVWNIATQPYREAHFATMPEKLVEPCIKAGSKPDDLVLDPFAGSGTVGVVAARLNRRFVGTELNETYIALARRRMSGVQPSILEVA